MSLILFRATFQAPRGCALRRMTFAASDSAQAALIAAQWGAVGYRARVLKVEPQRTLQVPQQSALVLT